MKGTETMTTYNDSIEAYEDQQDTIDNLVTALEAANTVLRMLLKQFDEQIRPSDNIAHHEIMHQTHTAIAKAKGVPA